VKILVWGKIREPIKQCSSRTEPAFLLFLLFNAVDLQKGFYFKEGPRLFVDWVYILSTIRSSLKVMTQIKQKKAMKITERKIRNKAVIL
jgi:hypothetical protein